MILPIIPTASMLMPAFVEPMFTEAQMCSVSESASGMAAISSRSPAANPFCTSAEKPPMKLTPQVTAALSSVFASMTASFLSADAKTIAAGVMEMRLLMIGMPNSFSIVSPVTTNFSARRVILS